MGKCQFWEELSVPPSNGVTPYYPIFVLLSVQWSLELAIAGGEKKKILELHPLLWTPMI